LAIEHCTPYGDAAAGYAKPDAVMEKARDESAQGHAELF
jgi:hypothetical protein